MMLTLKKEKVGYMLKAYIIMSQCSFNI